MGIPKVFNGGTDGCLELEDFGPVVHRLVVDDDVELEPFLHLHDPLDGREGDVDRVGVEVLKLPNRLEVLHMLLGYLRDFEQPHGAVVVDDRATLHVRLRLVRELHEELGLRVDEVAEDAEIDVGAEVIDVGDEDVLLPGVNELVEEARVAQGIKDVPVPGRVPLRLVRRGGARDGEKGVLVNTRVAGLVEGEDLDVVVRVFLDDPLRVLVRVEAVHQDERHVDLELLV